MEEDFGRAWKLSAGVLYSGIHAPAVSQGAGWAGGFKEPVDQWRDVAMGRDYHQSRLAVVM